MTNGNEVVNKIKVADDVLINSAWTNLIHFCQTKVQFGYIVVKVDNGVPGKLNTKESGRTVDFSKGGPHTTQLPDICFTDKVKADAEVNITDAWKACVKFCQLEMPCGTLRLNIYTGNPALLDTMKTERRIHFGNKTTIPEIYNNLSFK